MKRLLQLAKVSKTSALTRTIASVLPLFFVASPVTACLNVIGTSYEGEPRFPSGSPPAVTLRAYMKRDHRAAGIKMETDYRSSTNYDERSDYAISLVYLGRVTEAIEIFQKLEQAHPGKYFVAANLGTAFELTGNNEEALRWIQEGIRRNPASHSGTEWLHAKILQAKIAQQDDPKYFENHSILNLEPEHLASELKIDGQSFSLKEIARSIQYQLEERLQFVKPPDQAVAALLFDYAALEAATNTLESAKSLLQMALEYGYPAKKAESQLKLYDQRITRRKVKRYVQNSIVAAVGIGVFVLGIGALVLLYKRRTFMRPSPP